MLDLAKKYQIRFDWFYGVPGHGRGLIDAMAWFGCKGPMRKAIITDDSWFKNAQEMTSFLKNRFQNDPKKEHHLIEDKKAANLRKKGREERFVSGCSSAYVISIFPDGKTVKTWKTIKDFIQENEDDDIDDDNAGDNAGNNADNACDNTGVDEDEDVDFGIGDVWTECVEDAELFGLIDVKTFVAIRSPSNSLELFHLMRVEGKGVATENMMDASRVNHI